MRFESNYELIEELCREGRVFEVDHEDNVTPLPLPVERYRSKEYRYRTSSFGREAIVVPTSHDSGCTHEWQLVEPITHPFYLGNFTPVAVTVYEQIKHYGGPEEGGWYYWRNEPVAMFLLSGDKRRPVDSLPNAETAAKQWIDDNEGTPAARWASEHHLVAMTEVVPGCHTTVGSTYYC